MYIMIQIVLWLSFVISENKIIGLNCRKRNYRIELTADEPIAILRSQTNLIRPSPTQPNPTQTQSGPLGLPSLDSALGHNNAARGKLII